MVAIVTIAARSGSADTGANAPVKQDGFYGALLPPSFPAVNFALPDQHHQIIRLSDYTGQVVAAVFVYSTCASTCPIVVQQLSQAIDELPHPIAALAISVDPKQDTPANRRKFLAKMHLTGRMNFLNGPLPYMWKVWHEYYIQPEIGPAENHSAFVLLIDKRGIWRIGYPVSDLTPESLAHDIGVLEREPA